MYICSNAPDPIAAWLDSFIKLHDKKKFVSKK
jgi:hypothetical protein